MTFISVNASSRIHQQSIVSRSNAAIAQQLDQFNVYVETKQQAGKLFPVTDRIFNAFLDIYAPTRNEYFITLINGQLHQVRSYSNQSLALLQQRPTLQQDWSKVTERQFGQVELGEQRYQYAAEPFRLPGKQPGTLVVLYDATSEFQQSRQDLWQLVRNVCLFNAIFLIIAWITIGRVLSPLRQVTKTAQSITESDMHQRLPVRGKDEIAELTATFNEMLDRLQVAFESQKELLKDASHELRTPITVIQGHLEMLQYHPERQEATVTLVMDELERMGRLVNDLLLLAKCENPDFLKLKSVELDWLTEELYLKARSMADRQWRLESKGLSPITVDRQRLTQAVMNLLQNAIRYTQPDDTITLGSSVQDQFAKIWVRDTGSGIAPAEQQRIFDRFARGSNQTDQFEGHGLGLSIVQAIVQAHHGRVELDSRLGHGSTFTLIIPLVPLPTALPAPLTPSSPSSTYEPHPDRRRQPAHQFLPGNRTASERLHDHGGEHR